MKNILGTTENLELFNKDGKRVYWYEIDSDGFSTQRTYCTNGNKLTYKSSDGFSWQKTYDANGNELTFENSRGYSWQRTYDANNNQLTFKNSNGVKRGFDVPEFTMEQLVEKLGDFKIKL